MDYFRQYLKVAPLSHALWRTQETESISKIKLKKPILDLGCGFGEFAGVFYESNVEMGIDISENDLKEANHTEKYKKLILADARDMPFDEETFATVISISVIEHIIGTDEVLREVFRVLKKGGKFVFTTPHKDFTKFLFYPRLFNLFGMDALARTYGNLINKVFKHYSLYEENEWKRMLMNQGFKIEKIEPNIRENIALLWDLGLIFALPTQLTKKIFGKRLPISPDFRVELLYKTFLPLIQNSKGRACNLLIIARKPI